MNIEFVENKQEKEYDLRDLIVGDGFMDIGQLYMVVAREGTQLESVNITDVSNQYETTISTFHVDTIVTGPFYDLSVTAKEIKE